MEFRRRVSELSTFTVKLPPSGHCATSDPSGKKQAFPEKTPVSSSRISLSKHPGATSSSTISRQACAIGAAPSSVLAIISRLRTPALPILVRRTARPLRGESSRSPTLSVSPRHFKTCESVSGNCCMNQLIFSQCEGLIETATACPRISILSTTAVPPASCLTNPSIP